MAAIARHFRAWPLEDIYALYGREILAEAEHDPELTARLADEIQDIEAVLDEYRIRRHGIGGYTYLLGFANGQIQTKRESQDEPQALELYVYDASAVTLATVCQAAITWRFLSV